MSYTLPALPYPYEALEPHLDAETMKIHHTKHHQTYVDKLNAALEGHEEFSSKSVEDLLGSISTVPDVMQTAVRNHGGGHSNHSIFWQNMAAGAGGDPADNLAGAIDTSFGNLSSFREKFTATALGVFGSGWAWLVLADGKLEIAPRPNQDSPLMDGMIPLLGLDVWEHAYYLKYQNRRPEYVKAWWNVVNWKDVSERYARGVKGA